LLAWVKTADPGPIREGISKARSEVPKGTREKISFF